MTSQQKNLAIGNAVRREREQLRQRLHRREVHIADIVANPPACVGNMRLFLLFERSPSPRSWRRQHIARYHDRQARRWVRDLNMRAALANVNLFTEVDDLTPRARAWLVAELRRLYQLPMTGEDWQTLERQVFPVQREAVENSGA